jgi:hypothetical protein
MTDASHHLNYLYDQDDYETFKEQILSRNVDDQDDDFDAFKEEALSGDYVFQFIDSQ